MHWWKKPPKPEGTEEENLKNWCAQFPSLKRYVEEERKRYEGSINEKTS